MRNIKALAAAYLAGSYMSKTAPLMLQENVQGTLPPWAHRGYAHGPARGRRTKEIRTPNTNRFTAKARPGRNDPCSCGSGKKYKKCCLRASEPANPVCNLPTSEMLLSVLTNPEATQYSVKQTAEALLRAGCHPSHVYAYCQTGAFVTTAAARMVRGAIEEPPVLLWYDRALEVFNAATTDEAQAALFAPYDVAFLEIISRKEREENGTTAQPPTDSRV